MKILTHFITALKKFKALHNNEKKQASENLGILTSGIYASCVGSKKTAGGYKWKYVNDLNK